MSANPASAKGSADAKPTFIDTRHAARFKGGVTAETTERLKELGQLHEQGVLTDEEFASEKAKVLGI